VRIKLLLAVVLTLGARATGADESAPNPPSAAPKKPQVTVAADPPPPDVACKEWQEGDPEKQLAWKLVPSSTTIAPGGTVALQLELANRSRRSISIRLEWRPWITSVIDAAGKELSPLTCYRSDPRDDRSPSKRFNSTCKVLRPGARWQSPMVWTATYLDCTGSPDGPALSAPVATSKPLPPGRYRITYRLPYAGTKPFPTSSFAAFAPKTRSSGVTLGCAPWRHRSVASCRRHRARNDETAAR
jgi:hypothetical protein